MLLLHNWSCLRSVMPLFNNRRISRVQATQALAKLSPYGSTIPHRSTTRPLDLKYPETSFRGLPRHWIPLTLSLLIVHTYQPAGQRYSTTHPNGQIAGAPRRYSWLRGYSIHHPTHGVIDTSRAEPSVNRGADQFLWCYIAAYSVINDVK